MKTLVHLSIIFFSWSSLAYVPRINTIALKSVQNNGKNGYQIDRELSLISNGKKINFTEKWWVKNGDVMKVASSGTSLDGSSWKFAIQYKNGKRITTTASGKEKSFTWSPYFFEPLFHYRTKASFVSRLTELNMIPKWAKKISPVNINQNKTEFTKEPFVRLSRKIGRITYEVGSSVEKDEKAPRIWIEQDSFLIKKAKFGKNAELVNESHREYSGGLNFPLLQNITWKGNAVHIKTTAAKKMDRREISKKLKQDLGGQGASLPKDSVVREFYSRFR